MVLLVSACAALAAGCGGGTRQDAHEPDATFTVAVVHPSFPAIQAVARPATMTLRVRNTGTATIPNLAVTIDSFSYVSHFPELASSKRPIWVVEQGPGAVPKRPVQSQAISPPGGSQTAYVNTWALGPLAPGHTQTFTWRVTPVKSGVYKVHYTIAAGLAGRSRARLADGGIPHGHFTVAIAPRPPATHVNPETGQVEPGRYVPATSATSG
ncbi:MAG TPA: hypothetical protein VG053_02875 [Solirubrobacteraceae bacterium]|nr:hypothetical protein [Solirubrobacteraceae bacterium]